MQSQQLQLHHQFTEAKLALVLAKENGAEHILKAGNWWFCHGKEHWAVFKSTQHQSVSLSHVRVWFSNPKYRATKLFLDVVADTSKETVSCQLTKDKLQELAWTLCWSKEDGIPYDDQGHASMVIVPAISLTNLALIRLRVKCNGAIGFNRLELGTEVAVYRPLLLDHGPVDQLRAQLARCCGDGYSFNGSCGVVVCFGPSCFPLAGRLNEKTGVMDRVAMAVSTFGARVVACAHDEIYGKQGAFLANLIHFISHGTGHVVACGLSDQEKASVEASYATHYGKSFRWVATYKEGTIQCLAHAVSQPVISNSDGVGVIFKAGSSKNLVLPDDSLTEPLAVVSRWATTARSNGLSVILTPWGWAQITKVEERSIADRCALNSILLPLGMSFSAGFLGEKKALFALPENPAMRTACDCNVYNALVCLAEAAACSGSRSPSLVDPQLPFLVSAMLGSVPRKVLQAICQPTVCGADDIACVTALQMLGKTLLPIVGTGSMMRDRKSSCFPIKFAHTDPLHPHEAAASAMLLPVWDCTLSDCLIRNVPAAPGSSVFPGPCSGARLECCPYTFELSKARWQFTGLYCMPGQPVWLQIELNAANAAHVQSLVASLEIVVRIGCHTDALVGKEILDRYPKIATSVHWKPGDLNRTRSDETEISCHWLSVRENTRRICVVSPYGGLLYLETLHPVPAATITPTDANYAKYTLAMCISGGCRRALWFDRSYELKLLPQLQYADCIETKHLGGRTNAAYEDISWSRKLENLESSTNGANCAPWGEISGELVSLTLPIECLREIADPLLLTGFWDAVAASELRLVERKLNAKERIVADVQISAGYMHSGYPIMTHLDVAHPPKDGSKRLPQIIDVDRLRRDGMWGLYHELGHNRQRPEWTPNGTGEVTVNIFSLAACRALNNKSPFETEFFRGTAKKALVLLQGSSSRPLDWEKDGWADPQTGLAPYALWIHRFGLEAQRRVFRIYTEQQKLPKTNDEKLTQWVINTSLAVGKDLRPYWDVWGWRYSGQTVAQAVGHLTSDASYGRDQIISELREFVESGSIPPAKQEDGAAAGTALSAERGGSIGDWTESQLQAGLKWLKRLSSKF